MHPEHRHEFATGWIANVRAHGDHAPDNQNFVALLNRLRAADDIALLQDRTSDDPMP